MDEIRFNIFYTDRGTRVFANIRNLSIFEIFPYELLTDEVKARILDKMVNIARKIVKGGVENGKGL